jgi:hypothetical protein
MKLFASSIVALFVALPFASATPITVTADVVNGGTPVLQDSQHYDVGPYTLRVNGVNYAALCIDFLDNAVLNQSYSAYESPLNGSLSKTYNPTFTQQYKEEAVLLSMILEPSSDRIDIQHAAWAITDPLYHADFAAQVFENVAAANYNSVDPSQFLIISDVNQNWGRGQEFIISRAAATPEPATLVLMGSGLLFAGLFRRKKAKSE